MGFVLNREFRNVLASSADKTVKIWDIATETASTRSTIMRTGVEGTPRAYGVADGFYDKTAQVVDVRAPEDASLTWKVGAMECAIWHAGSPTQFLVSNEEGMVMCFDTRMGSKSIACSSFKRTIKRRRR